MNNIILFDLINILQNKKKGRRRGSKKKVNPEVARKLGEATLHYSNERYEEVCGLNCLN